MEHLIIAELGDKKFKVPVISIQLERSKEKVLIDIRASASFVATKWCDRYTVKAQKDRWGYEIRLPISEKHLIIECTILTLRFSDCALQHHFVVVLMK